MSTRRTIRLATRGSALARRQAEAVRSALEERRHDVDLVEVETTGDQIRDELVHRLGTTGAFVRSLDEQVLAGEVDAAVHSMKDMPTDSPDELIVAGIPSRADPGDVLLTPDGGGLDGLPEGARVGTASLRRRAQLLAARPDLVVEPLRGNVDTRVEKLLAPSLHREHERRLEAAEDDDEDAAGPSFERSAAEWFDDLSEVERRALERQPGEPFDAIVLAAAGLARLGLDHHVPAAPLPQAAFVPAPGQGALAVTAIDGSDAAEAIHEAVDDPRSRVETTVERVVLSELGGGCVAPLGVHAAVQGDQVRVRARVLSTDGDEEVAASRDLPIRTYAEAAREFAGDLRSRGAAELVAAATAAEEPSREDADDG